MKRRVYLVFLFVLMGIIANSVVFAKPTAEQMLFNTAQGKEFIIAIPPNETSNYSTNTLEIYVTSSKNTLVKLELPGGGVITKAVKAMEITTFSTASGDIGWSLEIRDSESPLNQSVRLVADQPISVYVLNAKPATSDGFLAIPVSSWGKEYFHCSYYDFMEFGPWASGFLVIAAENGTKVTMSLKGVGFAKTDKGKTLGQTIVTTLNKGQVYMVRGDAKTRGSFDMSGTKILASKKIGLISFHERTMIPSFNIFNGRDHLSEMLIPVQAWGKKYVTIDYKRDKGQGDFFRIMSSEPNTKWKCTYYDPRDNRVSGNLGGTLKAAGDFIEYKEIAATSSNKEKSVWGVSVWEADKPVQLLQYSYSAEWDGSAVFDPFMILVTPVEQYIPSTVFQTPANKSFSTNWFNIIATHDTNDLEFKDLKSIKVDGKPVWTTVPQFIYNVIPTTNLHWARIPMMPGAHKIVGEGTKFGGYIYGFSNYDSYGWPAAMAINNVSETDTLPPVLTRETECGDFKYDATELRNGKEGDNPRQVDQGIYDIAILDSVSYNYILDTLDFNVGAEAPPIYRYSFNLKVIDKTKKGFAVFTVADRYGNFTMDSVSWEPALLTLSPKLVDFGKVRVNTTKFLYADLNNVSDSVISIKELKLKISDEFKLDSGAVPPEIKINPKEFHRIKIAYTPKDETVDPRNFDIDSVLVMTECINYHFPVNGLGVIPKILVEDWNAGAVLINNKVCKETQTSSGLRIENPGTDTLHITNIKNISAPFELSNPFNPPLVIKIPPKGEVLLISCCFMPTEVKSYSINVEFECDVDLNDPVNDNISEWKGRGIKPGPQITSYDWKERRVKTVNDSVLILTNTGTSTLRVTDIKMSAANPNYKITGTEPDLSPSNPANLVPEGSVTGGIKEVKIFVQFTPQAEGPTTVNVVPEFNPADGVEAGSVYGVLDGIGILPKIEVIGYEFKTPILINTNYPTPGYVTIKSTSNSADLFIEKILPLSGANAGDFTIDTISPTNLVLPRGTSMTLPVKFSAKGLNDRLATITVVSDAAEGPNPNPRVNTDGAILGHVFEVGIKVTDIDYSNVSLCDQPVKSFNIANLSQTNKLRIDSAVFVSGDISNFDIKSSFPFTINENGNTNVDVRFKPDRVGNFSAKIRLYTEIGNDIYVNLVGVGYVIPVEVTMKKWGITEQNNEGRSLAPGITVPMDITFKSNNWKDAKAQDFKIEVIYNSSWMKFNNNVAKGSALDASWTVTATEKVVDATRTKLTIVGKGSSPINASGVVAIPDFFLLLSDTTKFTPQFNLVSFIDKDVCIKPTTTPGLVELNTCVINLRGIILNSTDYKLHSIEPNPVSGDKFNVKYDLGLKADTKIELFNSMGTLVKTIVNSELASGTYNNEINIEDLASGTYYIKLSSGPYVTTKSLVIAK